MTAAERARPDAAARPGLIVVGVDGSPVSAAALRWAAEEGLLRRAPVEVILTWHLPAVAGMTPMTVPPDFDLQAESQAALNGIIRDQVGDPAERPRESPITSRVVNATPAAALLEAAQQASLLVLGSRGHGGFAGLLIGSVSQHCVAHAPCPVVVVHAPRRPVTASRPSQPAPTATR